MKKKDAAEVRQIREHLMKLLSEERQPVCPTCNSKRIICYGHSSKQRYMCKTCGKTFSADKDTIFCASHQSKETWEYFIECELYKMTLKETAEVLNLSVTTCYSMRHKLYAQCAKVKEMLEYQQ